MAEQGPPQPWFSTRRRPVNWSALTSIALASVGVVSLLLTQLAELLIKAAKVVGAWHEFRRSLKP